MQRCLQSSWKLFKSHALSGWHTKPPPPGHKLNLVAQVAELVGQILYFVTSVALGAFTWIRMEEKEKGQKKLGKMYIVAGHELVR